MTPEERKAAAHEQRLELLRGYEKEQSVRRGGREPGDSLRASDGRTYTVASDYSLHLCGRTEAKAEARNRKRQRSAEARARRRLRKAVFRPCAGPGGMSGRPASEQASLRAACATEGGS